MVTFAEICQSLNAGDFDLLKHLQLSDRLISDSLPSRGLIAQKHNGGPSSFFRAAYFMQCCNAMNLRSLLIPYQRIPQPTSLGVSLSCYVSTIVYVPCRH